MREYLDILRRRSGFRRLWLAQLVSQTGDWLGVVAVSVVAGERDGVGGATALAWVLAAQLLPHALLSPFAGIAADRFDRRAILVLGNVAEGVVTVGMVFAAAAGSVATLSALVLVRSALGAAREPAAGAALPRLVAPDEVATANALGASTWSATFVVGMALGGVATELGPQLALGLDAATFALATLLLLGLPRIEPDSASSASPSAPRTLDMGLAQLRDARVRAAVLGKTPAALASGLGWIALNLFAMRWPVAGGAALTLGLLQAARGLGTGVGPIGALAILRRGRIGSETMATLAMLAEVGGAVTLALTDDAALAFAAVLAWGAGAGTLWVITATEIVERSHDRVRGRLMAIDAIGYAIAMSAGGAIAAGLVEAGASWTATALVIGGVATLGWAWVRRAPPAIVPAAQRS